jgi:multiple sugar transport system substrate-binding protein
MSKTKLYWIGGVVALLLVVGFAFVLFKGAFSGSGSNTGAPAKLTIWGTFEDTENMTPFISAYTEKNPNVQITYTQKNIEDYETDLLNALASGTGPDIFAIHNDWLPEYKDKLVPAPKEIFTAKSFKSAFVDVVGNDFVSDDQVYAAALSVDSLALYYNKSILGSAGIAVPARTWDDLKQDVKLITDKNGGTFIRKSGVALGLAANINRAVDILYLMMLQKKAVPYTDDLTQPTFDQAVTDQSGNTTFPASDALSFYTSFANANSDVYTWNSRSNYSLDAFVNGELGYMYGYSYLRDTIKKKAPNLNYDIAPIPQPEAGEDLVNYANYWGFAVSKQSKSPGPAWKFIASMTTKQNLAEYYARHPLPAVRKDMISDQVDTDMGVFATANLTAKSFYKKDASKVDAIFVSLIEDISLRGRSLEQALANANQKVAALRLSGEQQ